MCLKVQTAYTISIAGWIDGKEICNFEYTFWTIYQDMDVLMKLPLTLSVNMSNYWFMVMA